MRAPRLPQLSAPRAAVLLVAVLLVVLAGRYVRSTQHALDRLERQRDASCVAFASVGRWSLAPTASPLAREIVSTHADAARVLGCGR